MALFMKILRGSQNRTVQHKSHRLQREAVRKREDPVLYQVKMKLKNHPDTKYSSMNAEEMTKEALRLIDPEAMKEFFKELTHQPLDSIMEEMASERAHGRLQSYDAVRQKHLDRVGQLTLKLHLSHLDETPSHLARLGAALLKIPFGVLHASLEIGDTSNPNISYMVEFNHSSLVQPRRKTRIEPSALEATIALGGSRIRTTESWPQQEESCPQKAERWPQQAEKAESRSQQAEKAESWPQKAESRSQQAESWPQPRSRAEVKLREMLNNKRTGISAVDSYYGARPVPVRPRSVCMTGQSIKRASTVPRNLATPHDGKIRDEELTSSLPSPTSLPSSQTLLHHVATNQPSPNQPLTPHLLPQSPNGATPENIEEVHPKLQATPSSTSNQSITVLDHQGLTTGEDLTPFVQMSLSKVLLVEKLVKIIIKYNKSYYYHNITRNCQTFITEVLQSFGVWENFKLGERLEVYLTNLNKGRQEVYKCHKAVNDRVKYLVSSREIEETTYDEMRYLRSLYTIFHAEEFRASARPIAAVCSEPNCMLNVLEEDLTKKRPEGATRLLPPENYV